MKGKYGSYGPDKKYLDKITVNKEKVCATYTCKRFTAAHTSTQRAESANAQFKERGKNKAILKKFTLPQLLPQLLQHATSQHDRFQFKSIEMIRKLIQAKKHWSDYVQKRWDMSMQISQHFSQTARYCHR